MMPSYKQVAQRRIMHEKIIGDLKQFFNDRKIFFLKIEPMSEAEINFYRIHFTNETANLDWDYIQDELRTYGYIPKRIGGSLPLSFWVSVLRKKEVK
jgi:hypothetical protein